MNWLSENIINADLRVREACREAGIARSEVTLLGACKTMPAQTVRAASSMAGLDALGENRVQELVKKKEEGAYGSLPVHMIGALQTNKVRYVTGVCALIHSVDSVRLGAEIDRTAKKRGLVQDVLCEINIAGEEGKSGIAAEGFPMLYEELLRMDSLCVRGLMVIPPPEDSRKWFEKTRKLFERYAGKKFNILSMGMSSDFYEAILEGSNLVRVGTAIFGKRGLKTEDVQKK